MPQPRNLMKAELLEITWDSAQEAHETGDASTTVKVQFNPETLTVAFANQKAGGDQRGGSSFQFVGQGTTTLSLDLWFDAAIATSDGQSGKAPDDVRKLTEKVAYFMTPVKKGSGTTTQWLAPGVRFLWGTFKFDGIMDSLTEKLEFFSEDGKPLRAMVSIKLSSQKIQFQFGDQKPPPGSGGGPSAGTQPQTPARAGDSVQKMAARNGQGQDWKPMAEQNGIENPRKLPTGTLLSPPTNNPTTPRR